MSNKFTEGMQVLCYRDHHSRAPRPSTVTKVTKTQVTIDTGEKFTADGREWGNSKAWFHSRIEIATPERLAEIEAERKRAALAEKQLLLKNTVLKFIANDMTPDEIEQLAARLRNMGMPT
jgi:hypothetical protein